MDDSTWVPRLAVGLTILGVLAVLDVIKNPRNPKRLKEYAFLFSVTALAIGYGIAHDFVTYNICSEYFTVGYGLEGAQDGFSSEVVLLAAKAAWSAGLFIGLVLLIANNPSKRISQLSYRALTRFLLGPLAFSISAAVLCAAAANVFSQFIANHLELGVLQLRDEVGFLTVWGAHIGTYCGALVGLVFVAAKVRKTRRGLADDVGGVLRRSWQADPTTIVSHLDSIPNYGAHP